MAVVGRRGARRTRSTRPQGPARGAHEGVARAKARARRMLIPSCENTSASGRHATAKKNGLPAFVILHDTTPRRSLPEAPEVAAELLQVFRNRRAQAELYGKQILGALKDFAGRITGQLRWILSDPSLQRGAPSRPRLALKGQVACPTLVARLCVRTGGSPTIGLLRFWRSAGLQLDDQ